MIDPRVLARQREQQRTSTVDQVEGSIEQREISEQEVESLRTCIQEIRQISERFDDALAMYGELLQEQERLEVDLKTQQRVVEAKKEAIALAEKRTKLIFATLKYLTSSGLIGTLVGATTYAITRDAVSASMGGASGAMVGSVLEAGLSSAERESDLSGKYLQQLHGVDDIVERHRQWEDQESNNDIATLSSLEQAYKKVSEQIDKLEQEIDLLGATGYALIPRKRQDKSETENERVLTQEGKEKFLLLLRSMTETSKRLDEMLIEYKHLADLVDDAETDLERERLLYKQRDLQVQASVLSQKALQLAAATAKTVALGLGFGTSAYVLNGMYQLGLDPSGAIAAGGAAGASLQYLYFERFERNVLYNNLPGGHRTGTIRHQKNDELSANLDYQRGIDPELSARKGLIDQAKVYRDELTADQEASDQRIDEFLTRISAYKS